MPRKSPDSKPPATRALIPALPRGATDAHVHVLDPERFAFDPSTPYQPQPHEWGTAADLAGLLDAHGIDRVVLVNPTSGYGTDVRCLVDALRRLGPRARAIARASLDFDRRRLRTLARHGIVGVRLDFIADGTPATAGPFLRLLHGLADEALLLDIQSEGDQFAAIASDLARVPVRIVVDHMGRPVPGLGVRQAGFNALLALADTGRVAVKLSGAMRFSRSAPPHRDADRYVAALARSFGPERLVWGSDWPFFRSQRRIDYAPLLAQLARWFPKSSDRRRILVDTPARWFGFHSS